MPGQGCEVSSLPGPGVTVLGAPVGTPWLWLPTPPLSRPCVFSLSPLTHTVLGSTDTAGGSHQGFCQAGCLGVYSWKWQRYWGYCKCSLAFGSSASARCCPGVYLLAAARGRCSPCPSHRLLEAGMGQLGECPCPPRWRLRRDRPVSWGWAGCAGLCLGRAGLEEK